MSLSIGKTYTDVSIPDGTIRLEFPDTIMGTISPGSLANLGPYAVIKWGINMTDKIEAGVIPEGCSLMLDETYKHSIDEAIPMSVHLYIHESVGQYGPLDRKFWLWSRDATSDGWNLDGAGFMLLDPMVSDTFSFLPGSPIYIVNASTDPYLKSSAALNDRYEKAFEKWEQRDFMTCRSTPPSYPDLQSPLGSVPRAPSDIYSSILRHELPNTSMPTTSVSCPSMQSPDSDADPRGLKHLEEKIETVASLMASQPTPSSIKDLERRISMLESAAAPRPMSSYPGMAMAPYSSLSPSPTLNPCPSMTPYSSLSPYSCMYTKPRYY